MSTTFPTTLQDLDATRGATGNPLSLPNHITHHTNEDDTIEALQAKVGVDNSADTTTLDYKLKSTSSSNPGHKHTLANGATDVTASSTEVNVLDGIPATLTATELGYVDGVTSAIQTQLNTKAADSDVVHNTGAENVGGVKTFTSDPLIPDEAYGSGWNGVLEPPTKNAIYDKIETLDLSYTANTSDTVTTWDTVTAIPDADLGWTMAAISSTICANGISIDNNTNTYAYISFLGRAGTRSGGVEFSNSGWNFRIKSSVINGTASTANLRCWFGFTTDTNAQNSSDITNTTIHRAGLSWYNGALYFVTCNGSAVTATNIATRTGTVWDMIVVDFDGTTAKVWLNGTAYTTTSTVPTTGEVRFLFGAYNSGGGGSGIAVHGLNISTKFNA